MAPLSFAKSVPASFPHTFRFRISQDHVRSIIDPHDSEITIHHVYIPVAEFKREMLPDDINPRSHVEPSGRIPQVIERSLLESPTEFHLMNRGELILAQSCRFDNHNKMLEITIASRDVGGLADGGTTDRVIAQAEDAANRRRSPFTAEQVEESLNSAYVHLEIISGNVAEKLVRLAGARNTSNQVPEFALENLGKGFEWIKEVIGDSEFRNKIRYRENDPEDVDIRTILALLTMFHRNWNIENKDPVIAYTSKGGILKYFRDESWLPGYKELSPVVLDILRLFDHIHIKFGEQYQKYNREANDAGSRFGGRREVGFKEGHTFTLPLTGQKSKYLIPDGWLYPLLASFRGLLKQPGATDAEWIANPFDFFDQHGAELVGVIVEQSKDLGFNPQSVGKSRPVWAQLREKVENKVLRGQITQN